MSATLKEQNQAPSIEPRWPVVLTILAVVGLLALMPGRIRLFPSWFPYIMGIIVIAPMIAVWLMAEKAMWIRVERVVCILFFLFAGVGILVALLILIYAMLFKSVEVSGLRLLASSVSVWILNVLIFSILYWQIDRGGPDGRMNDPRKRPDWLFPQEGAATEIVPPGWHPTYVDYLFLSYSTATSFSATDVVPLTTRTKILMMLESAISMMTLVLVASRAINILGS